MGTTEELLLGNFPILVFGPHMKDFLQQNICSNLYYCVWMESPQVQHSRKYYNLDNTREIFLVLYQGVEISFERLKINNFLGKFIIIYSYLFIILMNWTCSMMELCSAMPVWVKHHFPRIHHVQNSYEVYFFAVSSIIKDILILKSWKIYSCILTIFTSWKFLNNLLRIIEILQL